MFIEGATIVEVYFILWLPLLPSFRWRFAGSGLLVWLLGCFVEVCGSYIGIKKASNSGG